MSNETRLHNCIRDVLCSGCSLEVRKQCYRQSEDDRAGLPPIQKTSELPRVIPPLPTGDTKDLKVWQDYWKQHDAAIRKDEREKTINEVLALTISGLSTHAGLISPMGVRELRSKQGEP